MEEAPTKTAKDLHEIATPAFRAVIADYAGRNWPDAIKRLAELSPSIRQILHGGGEHWLKRVFHEMRRLKQ